ncbi:unnamed protein product, partial [Larinioides sclopetarius]
GDLCHLLAFQNLNKKLRFHNSNPRRWAYNEGMAGSRGQYARPIRTGAGETVVLKMLRTLQYRKENYIFAI